MKHRTTFMAVAWLVLLAVFSTGLVSAENPPFVAVGSQATYEARTTELHPNGVSESINTYAITGVSDTSITVEVRVTRADGMAVATYRIDPRTRIVTNVSPTGDEGLTFWLWIPSDTSPGESIALFDIECLAEAPPLRPGRASIVVVCADNAVAYYAADDGSLLELDFPAAKWTRTSNDAVAKRYPGPGLVLSVGGLAVGGLIVGNVAWWASIRRRRLASQSPTVAPAFMPVDSGRLARVGSEGASPAREALPVPDAPHPIVREEMRTTRAEAVRSGGQTAAEKGLREAPTPRRLLATNAPADWPQIEVPAHARWAPAHRRDAVVAEHVAQALARHFSGAGAERATLRRDSEWPAADGVVHVPIELNFEHGGTIAIAAYASSPTSAASHFHALRMACERRGLPAPVYYAPERLVGGVSDA